MKRCYSSEYYQLSLIEHIFIQWADIVSIQPRYILMKSLNNVTKSMPEPISIIQIEHRIPYHESYQTVGQPTDAVLASNVTQSELNDAYRNVLLMTPSG